MEFLITYASSLLGERPLISVRKARQEGITTNYPERTFAFFFCESNLDETEVEALLKDKDLESVLVTDKMGIEPVEIKSDVFFLGQRTVVKGREGVKNDKAGTFIPLNLLQGRSYQVLS